MIPTYAIIPTSNRPDVALRCIQSIRSQVDQIYVIDNGDREIMPTEGDYYSVIRFNRKGELPNLSMLWNMGIVQAQLNATVLREATRWNVVILNDDAVVPDGWVSTVSDRMREAGAAAGCTGSSPHGAGVSRVLRSPGPVPLLERMTGWAFLLAGEKGARANEQILWYYTDDHLDWMSRQLGGMIMVAGPAVEHLSPNGQMTPELQEQTVRDRAAFSAYWNGMVPW